MTDLSITHWEMEGADRGAPVVLVHGIFTWADDDLFGFAAQRPLADDRRLLLVDRRGYGDSPDTGRSDFEEDARDIVDLVDGIDGGAHLVGHANGGLAALIAASERPTRTRSLTLIQPSVFWIGKEHPAIAALLARTSDAGAPPDMSAHAFLRASTEGIGIRMPEPTDRRLRAVRTSMGERPVWEAEWDISPVARAPWPKLVIAGDWEGAPPLYREYAGEALMAAAHAVAREIGADQLTVPGYYPHTQQPTLVNHALRTLWALADG